MTEPTVIRDDEGNLTAAGIALGEARLTEFINAHAKLSGMSLFLVISTNVTAARRDYTDIELDAVLGDADDMLAAAAEWRAMVVDLVTAWRHQRELAEQEKP